MDPQLRELDQEMRIAVLGLEAKQLTCPFCAALSSLLEPASRRN